MLLELEELSRIRLEEDLTFTELAAKVGMDGSGLHRLLHDGRQPQERTLYRIRQFLASRKPRKSRKAVA